MPAELLFGFRFPLPSQAVWPVTRQTRCSMGWILTMLLNRRRSKSSKLLNSGDRKHGAVRTRYKTFGIANECRRRSSASWDGSKLRRSPISSNIPAFSLMMSLIHSSLPIGVPRRVAFEQWTERRPGISNSIASLVGTPSQMSSDF